MQVKNGMTVTDVRNKLWNVTGIAPEAQRLLLPQGQELTDSSSVEGCCLQPGTALWLLQAQGGLTATACM